MADRTFHVRWDANEVEGADWADTAQNEFTAYSGEELTLDEWEQYEDWRRTANPSGVIVGIDVAHIDIELDPDQACYEKRMVRYQRDQVFET